MTGYLLPAVTVLTAFGLTAIGDMVSEEVRDRLDHVPQAILRLAARRLDPDQGSELYEEVWLPDLAYFLRGDKARPVTRLIHGTRYAIGILWSARRIARHLNRPVPGQPAAEANPQSPARWETWMINVLLDQLRYREQHIAFVTAKLSATRKSAADAGSTNGEDPTKTEAAAKRLEKRLARLNRRHASLSRFLSADFHAGGSGQPG